MPEEEIGMVLASVWQSRGIILAMPTYEYQMFPPVAHVLDDAFRKRCSTSTAYVWEVLAGLAVPKRGQELGGKA